MLYVISLASSSEGNAILVCSNKTKLLVDAGTTLSDLTRKLASLHIDPPEIKHILLTHEHQDHSAAAINFSIHYGACIYSTTGTLQEIKNKKSGLKPFNCKEIQPQISFNIEDLSINSFSISHDAAEPVGYVINFKNYKIAIFLDLAQITPLIQSEILTANLVILDSNYDRQKLWQGKYPYALKKRIVKTGHLSNETVANYIHQHRINHRYSKHKTEFWLAHLSRENNQPEIIQNTLTQFLGLPPKARKIKIKILPRKQIGPRWVVYDEQQLPLLLPEIVIPHCLDEFRTLLTAEQQKLFDDNFYRAQVIPLSNIKPIHYLKPDWPNGWFIPGKEEEGYVVAKEIDIVGISGIKIGDKLWSCECGDFIYRGQKIGLPCKHIIRVCQNVHNTNLLFIE